MRSKSWFTSKPLWARGGLIGVAFYILLLGSYVLIQRPQELSFGLETSLLCEDSVTLCPPTKGAKCTEYDIPPSQRCVEEAEIILFWGPFTVGAVLLFVTGAGIGYLMRGKKSR